MTTTLAATFIIVGAVLIFVGWALSIRDRNNENKK